MAAAQHRASRRALLGAAVALPVLCVIDGPVSGTVPRSVTTTTRWRRAFAAYEAAEAEVRAFERLTAGAPWEEQEAIEEGYGDRLDTLYAVLRRLLRTPAADLPALATKIVLVIDHEVATLNGGEACMAALKRDALRLAAAA